MSESNKCRTKYRLGPEAGGIGSERIHHALGHDDASTGEVGGHVGGNPWVDRQLRRGIEVSRASRQGVERSQLREHWSVSLKDRKDGRPSAGGHAVGSRLAGPTGISANAVGAEYFFREAA